MCDSATRDSPSARWRHSELRYYHKRFVSPRSTEDAQVIFRDAGEYNMTGEAHVWIVTEQALIANNTPEGVLGLQLEHAHSDKGHIRVSVRRLRPPNLNYA